MGNNEAIRCLMLSVLSELSDAPRYREAALVIVPYEAILTEIFSARDAQDLGATYYK